VWQVRVLVVIAVLCAFSQKPTYGSLIVRYIYIYIAEFFFLKDPIYLQSVTIHSANGGKGEGWLVEECSVALLC
jgi:hypothetical protein